MFDAISNFMKLQIHSLNFQFNLLNIGELLFITIVLFFAYKKYIQGTHSEKFVRGIFFLVLAWMFSEILIKIDLQIIGVFLKTLVSIVAFSLIVIFQPELRKLLGYLGQTGFMTRGFFHAKKSQSVNQVNIVNELIETVKYLSKTRCGGLIVLKKDKGENLYSEVGIKLNASLSCELLLTIFHPNTPLHDGAVIVHDDKILAAGVLLPLTEDPKLSWRYGTRHRAAIGMSEISDSACLVVSEETGEVSVAVDGMLKKYEELTDLRVDLENILGYEADETPQEKKILFNILKSTKK